jgi:hypothetical protein
MEVKIQKKQNKEVNNMGLPQYGGEGKGNYKGNKSDMTLKQHGGEGKELKKVNGDISYSPSRSPDSKYTGPGRDLKKGNF